MSDIEIARAATAQPIGEIAKKAGIPDEALMPYGVPVVVAINRFSADTDAEVQQLRETAAELGSTAIDCTHWGMVARAPKSWHITWSR